MKDIVINVSFYNGDYSRLELSYGGKVIFKAIVNDDEVANFKALAHSIHAEILKDIIAMILPKPTTPPNP